MMDPLHILLASLAAVFGIGCVAFFYLLNVAHRNLCRWRELAISYNDDRNRQELEIQRLRQQLRKRGT